MPDSLARLCDGQVPQVAVPVRILRRAHTLIIVVRSMRTEAESGKLALAQPILLDCCFLLVMDTLQYPEHVLVGQTQLYNIWTFVELHLIRTQGWQCRSVLLTRMAKCYHSMQQVCAELSPCTGCGAPPHPPHRRRR